MDNGAKLRVDRIIGNNVLLVTNPDTGQESILLGKGIGFHMKANGRIDADDPRIEKRFRIDDREQMKQYHSLLEAVDPEVIQITDAIIATISAKITANLHQNAHTNLASHIQFAVFRLRSDMEIINPFLQETKTLFPQEYEVARIAAELISQTFALEVPEDEIGFLTYHVYSAVQHVPVGQLVKISKLITELVELVEKEKNIPIPRDSLNYVRLISHLRFVIERIKLQKTEKNPFINEMKKHCHEEYGIALKLARLMKEYLQTDIPEDETSYLAMHLYRLFQHFPANPS
jgi:transcriptional antiterminator